MGVHDYTCSVCGEPRTYTCNEATQGDCSVEGRGNDEVWVELFFFPSDAAPESVADFEERRASAVKAALQKRGYDWGEWDFVPTLNYRGHLMEDGDATGVWRLPPYEGDDGESNPVELEIPEGHEVWAVNYCPPCHDRYVARSTNEPSCQLYLLQIGELLGLELGPDKAAFTLSVQDRVDRRRPAFR
jgi:hypothetical protein